MLQEAGMGPDGLASMAFGGQVQYKDNGGGFGIDSIFKTNGRINARTAVRQTPNRTL
jgi:hypothetical protein